MQHILMSEFIGSDLLKALRLRQATPNLALASVPLNQKESFEIWTPKWTLTGGNFTPLEVELLQRDRSRVTKIVSKLVWLMGAICIGEDDWDVGDRQPIYDWDKVINFVSLEGRCVNPIVTRVIFSPHAIIPIYESTRKHEKTITPLAWEVSPPHWSIVFDDLIPVEGNFRLNQAGDFVSVDIWTGKPVRREVRSGKFYVQYQDLNTSNRG